MTKQELLDKLKQDELKTDLPLKETANSLVFGEGSPTPKVLFLGEAPGRFEDLKGLPFIGAAGKILDELLGSINLSRQDVYITSVLHYRPPKNRDPHPSEILAFAPFLDKQIEILSPQIIATLGRYSLAKFLPDAKIAAVHGKAHKITWNGKEITIFPFYHPAAALYRREIKNVLMDDFKKLEDILIS